MSTKFLNVSTDSTLAENSNILVPSQRAIKNFIASKSIQLDFLQADTPTTYTTGQKWLKTSDNKLYTAISSSAWDSGVSVVEDQFFTFNDLLYYFDGSSIKEYSTQTITEQRAGTQLKTWLGTRAQYNALTSYDSNTLYQVVESNIDYALLATQTEFNNSSSTTAATPYQVKQELGNYLSLVNGGNLSASKVLGLTNSNNEVSTLAFNTSGQLTVSSGLYVTNALDVNSIVVRAGTIYKTNTSGPQVAWTDTYATTSSFGVVKPDGTTITINNGIISASGTGSLANTATGTDSLTILGTPASSNNAANVGLGSEASTGSTALGYNAKATASNAIQIGTGTNSTTNTAKIGSYEILNSTGTIPNARIPAATNSALGGVMLVYDSNTNTLDIRTVEESN